MKCIINKPFVLFGALSCLMMIIAGLALQLGDMDKDEPSKSGYMFTGGFFVAIATVFFVYALSWGGYPNPLHVRRRNLFRICALLVSHFLAFFISGGSKEFATSFIYDNAAKSAEGIGKTYSTLKGVKNIGWSILKFEPLKFDDILWVYVVLFIGFSIALFKVLRSWGWPCVCAFVSALGIAICLVSFWEDFVMPFNVICIIMTVFLIMLSLYFGKKYLRNPAIS